MASHNTNHTHKFFYFFHITRNHINVTIKQVLRNAVYLIRFPSPAHRLINQLQHQFRWNFIFNSFLFYMYLFRLGINVFGKFSQHFVIKLKLFIVRLSFCRFKRFRDPQKILIVFWFLIVFLLFWCVFVVRFLFAYFFFSLLLFPLVLEVEW